MNAVQELITDLNPASAVLIGGSWQAGGAGTFSVSDPADNSDLCAVADADTTQAAAAVKAAHDAGAGWAAESSRRRSEVLRDAFDAMRLHEDRLARLVVAENGKSHDDATAEIRYAAEFFRWFSEEAVRSDGDYGPAPAGGSRTVITHRPVGVAALVTPWNFPAAMVTRKLAPALAAGCTTLLKPAAETPLTAIAITRLLLDAGLPPGVVNLVPTSRADDIVGTWLADDRVRKLSFTGSTAVGRMLLRQSAERVLNSSMELGGNAPFVVMADADVDSAVAGAMIAKFRGSGQACTAANRFYVHEDVADEFTARLGDLIRGLRVGPGADQASQIGPLVNDRAVRRIEGMIDDALERGASIVATATLPPDLKGSFLAPTMVDRVSPESSLVTEEIFGPVAPIVRWRDRSDLLEDINRSELGLAAYVYSRDLRAAMSLAEDIDAGMIGINRAIVSDAAAPFGGVKQSGLGREGAREGLAEYQETQYLSIDWS